MTYRIPDLRKENEILRRENKFLTEENSLLKGKMKQDSFTGRLRQRFSKDEFLNNTTPKILLALMTILWLGIMAWSLNLTRKANIEEQQQIREACYHRCGGREHFVETSRSRGIDYCLCDTEDNGLVEMPAIIRAAQ